jgi:mono/diheme cytochrome c family protein
MRARMPAWHGNAAETADLAAYLAVDADLGAAVFPDDRDAAARLAWDAHCGTCHTLDAYRALRPSLTGNTREDFEAMLDMLPDLAAEMPAYGGDPVERGHLLDFLTGAAGAAPDRSAE